MSLTDTIFHNIYLKSKFMEQIYQAEEFSKISDEQLKYFLSIETRKGNNNLL